MKKTWFMVASAMVCFGLASVQAGVVVQDTFNSNITDDSGDALDAAWTQFGTPAVAAHATDGTNGVLDLSASDGFDGVYAGFAPFTMSTAGDSIVFSARMRHHVASAVNNGFRIGLVNSAGTSPDVTTNDTYGFVFMTNLGNGSSGSIAEAINNTISSGAPVVANSSLDLSGSDFWHTISGKVQYLGGNQYQLTFGIDGINSIDGFVYTDANPTFTFNRLTFGLGSSGAASGFQLDDVNITTIVPEPASMSAALVIGAGGLLLRRSR